MYPAELFGVPVPLDAPGVPNANLLDLLPDKDRLVANFNEGQVKARQAEEKTLADKIKDNQSKGLPVSTELVNAHKAAKAKVEEVIKVRDEHIEKVSNENKGLVEEVEKNKNYNTETTKFDKEPEQNKALQPEKKKALTDASNSGKGKPDLSQDPSAEAQMLLDLGYTKDKNGNWVEPSDEKVPPQVKTLADQVINPLKEAFGDLFSPRELARMALLYTGSRLMGYDHDASFGYSAKKYMDRIAAAEEQYQKDIRDDDYLDFTEESRKEFEKTRDYSVLRKKSTPVSMTETTGTTYVRGVGIVNTVKLSDDTEGVLISGKPVRFTQVIDKDSGLTLADIMEPVDKEVHTVRGIAKELDPVAEQARNAANSEAGFEAGQGIPNDSKSVSQQAANKFNKILIRNGASLAQAEDMKTVFYGAIEDYYKAKAQAKKDGDEMPLTVEAYIEQRMIEPLTNNIITPNMVKGTSAKNLRELNKRIYRGMDIKDKRNPEFQDEYINEWAATRKAWEAIGDERAEWARKAKDRDDYSAFTLWMSKTADEEIDKILEEAMK
jgi:hypothetical protein